MLERVEAFIRERDLIEPGGEVTVLVSGGADSTCLWHVLRELGYRVSALHVAHGLRGAESDEDARFCREAFGAEVVDAPPGSTEAELRELRYSFATDRLRATGHTASDQVESVLLGLVASGKPAADQGASREDGVVRPLLGVWREETRAWCDERGLPYREDSSNPDTKRGLIRDEILPLLERLDPRARTSLLALADERPRLPRTLERTLAGAAREPGRDEVGRPRRRRPRRARVRHAAARGDGALGAVDARAPPARPRGARLPAGGSPRRPPQESAGSARGRQGAESANGRLAARRVRRRGRRRPGCRGGPRLGRSRDVDTVKDAVGEVLIEEEPLQARIAELGAEISREYEGRDLLLVGVLKGAVFFMADLMRELTIPCEIDFMAISSYGAATDSSGVVRILKDLDANIAGRDVLVVEDIIDSGLTLSYLMRSLKARKPASLEICALLTKPERREIDVPGQVRRLRDPEQVRDRLRARLRRALPQPALRRRPASEPDSSALI